jgi:hypothetical protein
MNPMKALRGAALGLVVVLCLLAAAPVALADDGWTPRAVAGNAGDWIAEWVARIAGWFGWGDDQQPRATSEAAGGDCHGGLDPNGNRCPAPAPIADGDCHGGLDPTGTPCSG